MTDDQDAWRSIAGKELAERLGVEHREGPSESAGWPVANVTVELFKEGDLAHSFVARDGDSFPAASPSSRSVRNWQWPAVSFRLPDGTSHSVAIPENIKDGEGFYVSLAVTRLKPSA